MTRIIKGALIALGLSALTSPLCAQKTYTAASCNLSAVQAAINQELASPADGDIISIPAGTCTWTGATSVSGNFTHSVTIQGAGAISATTGGAGTTGSDLTALVYNVSTPTMLNLSVVAGKVLRITGIAILMNSSSIATNNGVLAVSAPNTPSLGQVRVDHMHFYTTGGNTTLGLTGAVTGVVDHDYFESPKDVLTTTIGFLNGESWNGASNGDGSWTDGDNWGTNKFIFVEDCRFRNGDIGDSNHEGARYVFRYNTVAPDDVNASADYQGQFYNHGLTDGRGRSTRAAEVYHNTFIQPAPGANHPAYSLNGGTLLFWGNTVTQYRVGMDMSYTRNNNQINYNYGSPPSGWGTCTGSSGTVWDGPGGYPCMDQGARGKGDLLTGGAISSTVDSATGTQSWSKQALSPIYIWQNTYNPAGFSGSTLVNQNWAGYVQGRDYFMDYNGATGVRSGTLAARPTACTANAIAYPAGNSPGQAYWATDQNTLYVCTATNTWTSYYTPYTYPHPLAAGTGTTTGTPGPTPPTNLVTAVH